MNIKYSIRAQIVDISADIPQANDAFLVDTNAWYWLTYLRASQNPKPPQGYQTVHYPAYINKALDSKSLIYFSVLSLAELTHLIERSELQIFQALCKQEIGTKEYRHNHPKERLNVISQVRAAWGQIAPLAKPIDEIITADQALIRFQNERVDGYDLLLLESMKKNNITKIITDDGDFSTVSGIQVYTANKSVIQAAGKQGKLIKR